MTHPHQSDISILQDQAIWRGGPTWDLEFHVSLSCSTKAVMALLQSRRLRGWWQSRDAKIFKTSIDRKPIQDSLGNQDGSWAGVLGFALVEANRELPCSVDAWIVHENDAIPRPTTLDAQRGEPAYALVRLVLPAGGLQKFFSDADTSSFGLFTSPETWNVAWVNQLATFFKSVAVDVLSSCDADLAWFGMEGADFEDAGTVTENNLHNPYNAIYLPKCHSLSTTHGGVEVAVGSGYRFWGLGGESSSVQR